MNIFTREINGKDALLIEADALNLSNDSLEKLAKKFRPAYPDIVIIVTTPNGVHVDDPKQDEELPFNLNNVKVKDSPFSSVHVQYTSEEITFKLKEYESRYSLVRYMVYKWMIENSFPEELFSYKIFIEFDQNYYQGYAL